MLKKNSVVFSCVFNYSLPNNNVQLKCLIFYLLFLNFCVNSSKSLNFSFFLKKTRKDLIVINKAPYRYKLSRHQFTSSRFRIMFCISFMLLPLKKKNFFFLNKLFFFFTSVDFCFFSLHFFKVSAHFSVLEWLS